MGYLTGGTLVFEGQAKVNGTGDPNPENAKTYPAYRFWYGFKRPSEANPLPSGALSGDSGSPCCVYNENSGQWEWVGAAQSAGGSGYGLTTHMRSGNQWAQAYVDSFNRTVSVSAGGGAVLWNVTDADGNGTFVQGDLATDYTGLASGLRGDTSTQGTQATNEQLNACTNLIFDGSGGAIVLQGSVDTGAGSLTFNHDYVLSDGGNASYRLNTAGFVVNKGAAVTTLLTGASRGRVAEDRRGNADCGRTWEQCGGYQCGRRRHADSGPGRLCRPSCEDERRGDDSASGGRKPVIRGVYFRPPRGHCGYVWSQLVLIRYYASGFGSVLWQFSCQFHRNLHIYREWGTELPGSFSG